MIKKILSNLKLGDDSIYSYDFVSAGQEDEIKFRESIALNSFKNYLSEVANHHSIPVMDREVDLFLRKIPLNGVIIDAGGCWGWHWRRNFSIRPDVTVFVVDFVRSNLFHAKNILNEQVNKNIFLVHGDMTSLIFDNNTFNGWWSVQALQQIPDFKKAVGEAWRVLKPGGIFANYSLNNQALLRLLYMVTGKDYHTDGMIPGVFFLGRASMTQVDIIEQIFETKVNRRYSEVLFHPDLKIKFSGREKSITGKIDSFLSLNLPLFSFIARQQSFHTVKVLN